MDNPNYIQLQGFRYQLTENDLKSNLTLEEGKVSYENGKVYGVKVPNRKAAEKCLAAWRHSLNKRKDPLIESNIRLLEGWKRKMGEGLIAECARRRLQL